MLGAIIGDIAGSRFEFNRTNDYNFELFTDECGFTDDTICTCAVADALLNGRDYGDALHEWCRKYPHPTGGYGGRFAKWVRSENPQPYGSFGNGSAMRVSPVGWFCKERNDVLEEAKKTAECTHNHLEGIKGAQTVALAIYVANQHRRSNEQTADIVKSVIDECVKFSGYNINIRREDVINKFDETCQGTVPVALWIIKQSNSFEDAIRRAVCLGADADTLGAIVGSIAEAIWGIPKEIKVAALSFLDDRMKNLLSKWMRDEENELVILRNSNIQTMSKNRTEQPNIASGRIDVLEKDEIFVFGSNLAGHHGGGAARAANMKFGAEWGVGVGLTGQSYAIPTMQGGVETIKPYVDEFIEFAKAHADLKFLVTRIGCGIAGFKDEEIAPLFTKALSVPNIFLPQEFYNIIVAR